MSVTSEQKNKIENNIRQLDYLEGTGVLNSTKKQLVDEFFVFISAGGAGKSALAELLNTMKRQVDASEIENKAMFLAVDTDWKDTEKYVNRGVFRDSQVLKIPYQGAHKSINPDKILPQVEEWVHEDLWSITGGAAADIIAPEEMNGTGAGQIRQCGRVLFTQSAAQNALYNHLSELSSKLAGRGNPKIKVFFLTGLAGGTGSGTIVDLAYLCRHYLKKILGTGYERVSFSSYLFLPSGCGLEKNEKKASIGNQNAYAAFKEIDHYMSISDRGETFKVNYGHGDIETAENIFDFATLVEGIGNGGRFFEDSAKTARKIVADSILNIICEGGEDCRDLEKGFLVDSFLSNRRQNVPEYIKPHSDKSWPRDANYIYNVIGFSSCIVPIDLLTVYVAKKIFDEVFRRFRKAELATEDRAADFLHACGLEPEQLGAVWKKRQVKELLKDIEAQADVEFKANGPYYMVNLTKEASNLLEQAPSDYLHKARSNKEGFFTSTEKWKRVEFLYEKAINYLREINHSLYDVYTYSIEVLKNLIEKNARLLTDTNEYENVFGKSFQWSPIDLRSGDHATKAVIEYLDNLLSPKEVEALAVKFMNRLCEKKDEWTGLTVDGHHGIMTYSAAKEIREFLDENLKQCISTTMEEFLVKAYSGKQDAAVFKYDEQNNQVYSDETAQAAESILKKLGENATPLAQITGINLGEESYSRIYLTIPENCPWLYKAVIDKAMGYGIHPEFIYQSTARDRIVHCSLCAGIPAWAFFWLKGAEEEYEKDNGPASKTGLHMEQGKAGKNWAELPNLYPERLWSKSDREKRGREEALSKQVRVWMKSAEELDLLTENTGAKEYMDLAWLTGRYSAKELLEKAELDQTKKYTLKEVLDKLRENGALRKERVEYSRMVMSTPEKLTEEEWKAFRFDLACRIMRRYRSKWEPLQQTIKTVEELKALNESRVVVKPLNNSFIGTFVNAAAWELIIYDGRRGYWKNCLGDETRIGEKLETKIQRQCAHYYGYQAFAGLEEETLKQIKSRLDDMEDEADDDTLDRVAAVKKEMRNSLEMLRTARRKDVQPWKADSPFAADGNDSRWPMATEDFVDTVGEEGLARSIRKFYDTLIDNV